MPIFSGRCYSKARLDGKTAIVTGCNTGIGKETVLDFYKRGARIIMACRDLKKTEDAKIDILNASKNVSNIGEIRIEKLDLSSLTSVREFCKKILATEDRVNLLINNAGVMVCPEGKTEDGFETQIGTNHMGHFLLTLLLLPKIISSKPSRIVNVSSLAHALGGHIDFDDMHFVNKPYSAGKAYGQSKLANVLFSSELARKLKEHNIEGVNTYSLHPGSISTELNRHVDNVYFPGLKLIMKIGGMLWLMKTPELGAQTTIYCAVDEKCANETGLYYSDCALKTTSKEGRDQNVAEKLWEVSLKSVGLVDYNPFVTSS